MTAIRTIPPEMDAATVAEIDGRLDVVEREHHVRIAFAIESGSRAWGFPSPDSDYDCRFVYVRPLEDHLRLFPKRDVIETPLTPQLDVNGWDLAKALKLLLNGNAVIIEWLTSPIVYRAVAGFREEMLALAGRIADREKVAIHYLHLARRQRALALADGGGAAPLKKLFYVLRPAIALRWMRLHPEAKVAPMHFPTLCGESMLPAPLAAEITRLLAEKAQSREMGAGPVPEPIRAIIEEELGLAASVIARPDAGRAEAIAAADGFYRSAVMEQRQD
jgi:hypothetical protein